MSDLDINGQIIVVHWSHAFPCTSENAYMNLVNTFRVHGVIVCLGENSIVEEPGAMYNQHGDDQDLLISSARQSVPVVASTTHQLTVPNDSPARMQWQGSPEHRS